KTALLNWSAPADRGAPITKYTVYGESGFRQDCPANTCTLTGLVNNTKYHFEVTATNEFGESERSPASAEVRPDVKPDTPPAPTLKFGDKQLSVNWVAPASKGSPVKTYDLEISPAPPGQNAQIQNLAAVSYVWKGLQNGVSYKVRVLARNDAKDPSEWSPYSAAEVPAGVPATPAAPTATQAGQVGSTSQLKVSWTAPNNNGDAVSSYTLTTLQGGAVVATQPVASGTTQNVTVDNSESNYTFTVSATNKAGTSATSNPSAQIRAAGKPGQVSSGTVADTGNSGQLRVTFTPLTQAQRNGSTDTEIQYTYNADGKSGSIQAGGGTIGGLTNGRDITVTIIATSTKNNVSGDAKAIGTGNPYGPPNAPTVNGRTSAKGDGQVHWTWNNPNTNGRPLNRYEVSMDGGGWQNVGQANSFDAGAGGWGKSHNLRVRAVTVVDGAIGGPATSTSGADPTPPPDPTMVRVNTTNSCPGKPGVPDRYSNVNGDARCGSSESNWVSTSDGWIPSACWMNIYGSSETSNPASYYKWYRMDGGPHAGWYVKLATIDISGPDVGRC
uniref:fibronectin type III domain-containing protein n=1 Tax=Pseudarthrobacter sp. TaxID=1934409 RepID=UPI002FCB9CED